MNGKLVLAALCLTLLCAPLAFAQARVQGVVLDEEGKPIEGAVVTLQNPEAPDVVKPIKTRKNGKWAALLPMGGAWNIDIEKEGYVPGRGSMQISEVGRTPPLEIVLRKVPEQKVEQQPVEPSIPPEAVAAVEAGEAFMKEQKWAEAAAEFEKALALLPDNVQIRQVLAQAYYQAGRKDEALEMLRGILEEEPDNLPVTLLLSTLLLEAGELEEGRALLDRVPAEALDPRALVNVAILFLNRGEQDQALEYLDRAVALAPESGVPYYYQGLIYVQMGNVEVGAKKLEAAQEQFEKAVASLEKLIELAPGTPEAAEAATLLEEVREMMEKM
ncbi:MAG: tetratricopeptide repeat protein [Thermoanaerobaculia bacterium]